MKDRLRSFAFKCAFSPRRLHHVDADLDCSSPTLEADVRMCFLERFSWCVFTLAAGSIKRIPRYRNDIHYTVIVRTCKPFIGARHNILNSRIDNASRMNRRKPRSKSNAIALLFLAITMMCTWVLVTYCHLHRLILICLDLVQFSFISFVMLEL